MRESYQHSPPPLLLPLLLPPEPAAEPDEPPVVVPALTVSGARYDFGYELEIVRDRPLVPLVGGPSAADQDALAAALQACLAAGSFEGEMAMTRRDRRTFPARVSLTVRKDAFGSAAGYVLIAKDLTEERRAEEERRVALERLLEIRRLGEVDKIKTALLNTTSHELATPLTPIKVQLHLLKSASPDRLDPPLRKAVESLDRNFGRFGQVVQGMIDVVRLQGGVQLETAATDLAAIAREAVADNQAAAEAAGIRLVAAGPTTVPVVADAARIRQVAQHLVANALRFTPRGGQVTVEAEALAGRAEVRVRDTGRGLTADQMGRLFQPFGQVHDTSQETKGGIGVGLYICKAVVEAHGGRMRVASDGPGRGCLFTLELPAPAT